MVAKPGFMITHWYRELLGNQKKTSEIYPNLFENSFGNLSGAESGIPRGINALKNRYNG